VLDDMLKVQIDARDESSKDDQTQGGCYHAPEFALEVCHVLRLGLRCGLLFRLGFGLTQVRPCSDPYGRDDEARDDAITNARLLPERSRNLLRFLGNGDEGKL
jgi:hypothetical protein